MNAWKLHPSPTVATLNARGELAKLRMLVNPNDDGARREIDRLEEVLAEAFHLDGEVPGYVSERKVEKDYVSAESYDEVEQEKTDAEEERDRLKDEVDGLKRQLEDATSALNDSPDEVRQQLADVLRKVAIYEQTIARLERDLAKAKTPAADMAKAVREALTASRPPNRRSKPACEQWEKTNAAVEKALPPRT